MTKSTKNQEGKKKKKMPKENFIGSGSFGYVFHDKKDPRYCFKYTKTCRYDPNLLDQETFREITFLRHFRHPNIVELHSLHMTADCRFVRLGLRNGGITLFEWIKRHDAVYRKKCFRIIVAQIASVINFIRSHGVIHGDLSFNNVLIDSSTNKITVIDWGSCSFWVGSRSNQGCSPWFTNSSVAGSGDFHDIYALGVLAYYILTGKIHCPVASKTVEGFDKSDSDQMLTANLILAPTKMVPGKIFDWLHVISVPGKVHFLKPEKEKEKEREPSAQLEYLLSKYYGGPEWDEKSLEYLKKKTMKLRATLGTSCSFRKCLVITHLLGLEKPPSADLVGNVTFLIQTLMFKLQFRTIII